MLPSWMDIYVSIFVLAGLVVAFLSQWGILRGDNKGAERGRGIGQLPRDKRNAFTWVAFFSLTLIGLLIPIVAFAFKTTPNNPLVEVPFCFFYILGPFLILRWLVINRETGGLAVSPPALGWVYLIGCWIWPWKLWKSKLGSSMLFTIAFPIFLALWWNVSFVLVISILPSLVIFSIVFDIIRVHD